MQLRSSNSDFLGKGQGNGVGRQCVHACEQPGMQGAEATSGTGACTARAANAGCTSTHLVCTSSGRISSAHSRPPSTVPSPQGFIYVEAAKESHVMDAIRGLRTVYVGKGAKLVPLNEMPDAVTVNKKAKDDLGERSAAARNGLIACDIRFARRGCGLGLRSCESWGVWQQANCAARENVTYDQCAYGIAVNRLFCFPCRCPAPARDTWVRVRGGLYKDDLARVVDVDPVAGRATIKLLHRLDFNQLANRVRAWAAGREG